MEACTRLREQNRASEPPSYKHGAYGEDWQGEDSDKEANADIEKAFAAAAQGRVLWARGGMHDCWLSSRRYLLRVKRPVSNGDVSCSTRFGCRAMRLGAT